MAKTLCSQLLIIKIAIYLFAQDQIASYCINVCMSKYTLHVYYVCNPKAERSHTEQSMGDGFMLSHAVKSCPAQQELDPEHVTICQLYVCIHYAEALCTCMYIENASTMFKLYTE